MHKKTCGNTNLPADTRGQVLHNQAVLSAHWRRVSTENSREKVGKGKKRLNQLNANILGLIHTDSGTQPKRPH